MPRRLNQLAGAVLAALVLSLTWVHAQTPAGVAAARPNSADLFSNIGIFFRGASPLFRQGHIGDLRPGRMRFAGHSLAWPFRLMTPPTGPANASSSALPAGFGPLPAGLNLAVIGSGAVGQLTKWTGFTGSNSLIADSVITEDKFGNIGIGTTAPASRLTVAGTIQTLSGGFRFPDGTVQTTAAVTGLSAVSHDSTLTGNGASGSPLGVAVPLNLTLATGNPIINLQNTGTGAAISVQSSGSAGVFAFADPGDGVFGKSGAGQGVEGQSLFGIGVKGSGPVIGVRGEGSLPGLNNGGIGVYGKGGDGQAIPAGDGVVGQGGSGITLAGEVRGGVGVRATGGAGDHGGEGMIAVGGIGNVGNGPAGDAVVALGGPRSDNIPGIGVLAVGGDGIGTEQGGDALVAQGGRSDTGPVGRAGTFVGDVQINGALSVTGTKNFKIDHPLDPENKYLLHAAVESSEVLNIYSGNVVTDRNGEATVFLPAWFESLNADLRYQLTVIGTFAQAIVAEKVRHNRFTIRTSAPGVEVSWQVTGVRSDAVMLRHPFNAEIEKPEPERGTYLNPDAFSQPEQKGLEWARHPDLMQKTKDLLQKRREELGKNSQADENR